MRRFHHAGGLRRRGVGSASALSVLRRIRTLRIRPVRGVLHHGSTRSSTSASAAAAALFADPPREAAVADRTALGPADAFTNHLYDGHKEREAVNRRLQAIVEDEPLPQILYHPTTTIAFTGDGSLVACDGKEVLTFNAKAATSRRLRSP